MVELRGVNEFADLARAARLASGDLPKEMRKGISKIGPPAKKAVKASAAKRMPKKGGYAAVVEKTLRVRVKQDHGFTTAGVTIVTYANGKAQRRDVPALNRGILRHPVYGHRRRKWVAQKIRSGFWDEAMDETSDAAEAQFAAVLDETAKKLT